MIFLSKQIILIGLPKSALSISDGNQSWTLESVGKLFHAVFSLLTSFDWTRTFQYNLFRDCRYMSFGARGSLFTAIFDFRSIFRFFNYIVMLRMRMSLNIETFSLNVPCSWTATTVTVAPKWNLSLYSIFFNYKMSWRCRQLHLYIGLWWHQLLPCSQFLKPGSF